jgi:hypothetical protein
MKLARLLLPLALIVGLLTTTTACVAEYDDPDPAYPVAVCAGAPVVVPDGFVLEQPCVYYRVYIYGGVPYRYYYGWGPGGWVFHGWMGWNGRGWYHGGGWRGPVWHGGFHYEGRGGWHGNGGYHGGGGHGGGGHGGHR